MWYSRLRAAVQARDNIKSDIVIIARTDARQKYGFDEAIERLKEAVKIGVDVAFLEALQSKEECKKVCDIMGDTPVLFNQVFGGASPDLTVEEAKELGFRLMIFPGVCLEAAVSAFKQSLASLKLEGKQNNSNFAGVRDAFKLCGLDDAIAIDKKAGGKAYQDV